jgi:UDP-GlcNAc:undecaprenyl-phosphate/decaprenyl-phosphate GlcNAc-1-phosphate transferase
MELLARYFLAALAISLVATPLCRLLARRWGFVAKPREERWHRQPTAMFGGVAIALTTLLLGLTMSPDARVWQLMGCGFLMAAFGLLDDVLPLKASTKLIAQILLASALVFFGLRLHWTGSMVGDAMLTLFWIVGITNGFNLLDNMDGLCAGTTLIAGLFLLIGIVHQSGSTPSAAYLTALLGATTGFLVYNVHPASIFMGDTGSLFLGLNLAALTLVHGQAGVRSTGIVSIVAGPVLLLLIPIFDTTLVTVMRLLSGRRPSQGGRDHSSHRLVAIGLPESTAVAVLWALAIFGGVIALSLQMADQSWSWLPVSIFVLAMIIFAVYLARIRVYADTEIENAQASRLTPLLADFMYKRRVAEVLLDLCLIPVAYSSAYHLRFPEPAVLAVNYPFFIESLPIVVACQLIALFVVGGYRGTWRFFGLMDAIVFAKGVLLGTAAAIITLVFMYHFASYSREVFVIYAALIMLLLVGTRASFRVVGEFILRHDTAGERCVIYGTGGATLSTIREAFGDVRLKIVGFIDDDPAHQNTRVVGYSVLGDYAQLVSMIERHEVDCVVVNSRLVAVERLQELERQCAAHEVDLVSLRLHLTRLPAEAS